MCVFCEQDAQTIGKFFGYHQCCIDWYVGHGEKYGRGDTDNLTEHQHEFNVKTEGIAFMACPSHAKNFVEGNLDLSDLVINRIHTMPFPEVHDGVIEELEDWVNKNI